MIHPFSTFARHRTGDHGSQDRYGMYRQQRHNPGRAVQDYRLRPLPFRSTKTQWTILSDSSTPGPSQMLGADSTPLTSKTAQGPYYIPRRRTWRLLQIQRKRVHIAVVMTSMAELRHVTIEDLLEQIVGDIQMNTIRKRVAPFQPDGAVIVDARLSIEELNSISESRWSVNCSTPWRSYLPSDGKIPFSGRDETDDIHIPSLTRMNARSAGKDCKKVKQRGRGL